MKPPTVEELLNFRTDNSIYDENHPAYTLLSSKVIGGGVAVSHERVWCRSIDNTYWKLTTMGDNEYLIIRCEPSYSISFKEKEVVYKSW